MKTKIVYISGNELFDMADIRSAFDEVRNALSLGPDTVLFGVPVDNDDALATTEPAENVVIPMAEPIATPVIDDVPDIVEPVIAEEKKPTPRRAHKSQKVVPISDAVASPEPIPEPVQNPAPESKSVAEPAPVVPILSVLGSKSADETDDTAETESVESVDIETIADDDNVETDSVTITDMIADEAPNPEHEKTLEELLESMTPLGEDAEKQNEQMSIASDEEEITLEPETKADDDIDITLEKLATEFVENQDKIGTAPKPATRGKIGKLKNILPFKKAKHDDSGLMGDLFGWAGVAANDEDFTIPGFFK